MTTSSRPDQAEGIDLPPQINLIAVANSIAPRLILQEHVSVVPAESVLFALEIKSRLDQETLEQVGRQNAWIGDVQMAFPQVPPQLLPPGAKLMIPTAILAYDGPSDHGKVIEGLKEKPEIMNTAMVCVLGRYSIKRDSRTPSGFLTVWADENFSELMHFVADYWFGLEANMRIRDIASSHRLFLPAATPYPHPLEAYLKPDLQGRLQTRKELTAGRTDDDP